MQRQRPNEICEFKNLILLYSSYLSRLRFLKSIYYFNELNQVDFIYPNRLEQVSFRAMIFFNYKLLFTKKLNFFPASSLDPAIKHDNGNNRNTSFNISKPKRKFSF